MRSTLAPLLILVALFAGAQTQYNYNVPCGTDYYFVAPGFGNILWSSNSDTAVDVNFFDLQLKKNFYITAVRSKSNMQSFYASSDSLYLVSFEMNESGTLSMLLIEEKGMEEKTIEFTRKSSSEAISIDYVCFYAHRAIYFDAEEGGRDSVVMELQHRYPMPAKGTPRADSIRFVKAMTSHQEGLPVEFTYPADMAKNSDIRWIQDYTSMYETGEAEIIDYSANWQIDEQTIVILQKNGLLGFVESNYEYAGGAHGVYSSFYYIYNFKTDTLLQLADLFVDNFEPALEELINKQIRIDFEISDDAMLSEEGFFVESIPVTSNFTFTDNGILFLYNVYEVAPYVYGSIAVEIQFDAIKSLIRPHGPIEELMNIR